MYLQESLKRCMHLPNIFFLFVFQLKSNLIFQHLWNLDSTKLSEKLDCQIVLSLPQFSLEWSSPFTTATRLLITFTASLLGLTPSGFHSLSSHCHHWTKRSCISADAREVRSPLPSQKHSQAVLTAGYQLNNLCFTILWFAIFLKLQWTHMAKTGIDTCQSLTFLFASQNLKT